MRDQEDRSQGANPSQSDPDADADAKHLTGEIHYMAILAKRGQEDRSQGANPTQSEARSGKKTVRQLSSCRGGGGIH